MLKLHPGKEEGRGEGERGPHATVSGHTWNQLMVNSHPQKSELAWAWSHRGPAHLKMANNSAEKKGACNQRAGAGMEVHIFLDKQLQRPRSMNLGQCFLQQTPGLGIPVCSFRLLWTLASAVQEPAPVGYT